MELTAEPASKPREPLDWAHAETMRRVQIVQDMLQLESEGVRFTAAAERLGVPKATASRTMTAFRSGGFRALVPIASPGRNGAVEKLKVSPEEVYMMALFSVGKSVTEGVKIFMGMAWCREELRQFLSTHCVPRFLSRAIREKAEQLVTPRRPQRTRRHNGSE